MRNRKNNIRKPKSRVLILCEGAETEPKYFNGIKNDKRAQNVLTALRIEVHDTKKNTAKELVAEAIDLMNKAKKEGNPYQKIWVVFDKDGYTKHPESFDTAKAKDIAIAFSSVSFEYWFLLHFVRTSKQFRKAGDLIRHLKENGYRDYEKNADHYRFLKPMTKTAMENAEWLRSELEKIHGEDYKCYEHDAYTDVDKLVEYLLELT